jgi:hypothetical protein
MIVHKASTHSRKVGVYSPDSRRTISRNLGACCRIWDSALYRFLGRQEPTVVDDQRLPVATVTSDVRKCEEGGVLAQLDVLEPAGYAARGLIGVDGEGDQADLVVVQRAVCQNWCLCRHASCEAYTRACGCCAQSLVGT